MKPKPAALVALIVVLAVAVGAAAFLLRPSGTKPPQDTQSTPTAEQPETASPLPVVRAFTVLHEAAAYVEPDRAAPKLYDIPAGSPLCSADITQDGKWIAAMTADGQPAWIEAGDLGPFDKTAVPHGDLPDSVSGTPEVVNSGMLKLGDYTVTLAGLSGLSGDFAQQMTNTIAKNGNRVECERHGAGYTCKLPVGADVGRIALYNGIAVDSGCATADYLQQEEAARAAPRGIWR